MVGKDLKKKKGINIFFRTWGEGGGVRPKANQNTLLLYQSGNITISAFFLMATI